MTVLLALITVIFFGTWILVSQVVPGVPQRLWTFCAGVGNLVLDPYDLVAGGGHLSLGWRHFWLPLAGGVVWTARSFAAFRAAATIGLARAAGTWTPLNIITSFVWGALLFGELHRLSASRFAVLGGGLAIVLIGVLLIVGSQDPVGADVSPGSGQPGTFGRGIMWATAAGVLWGSYFVPAQWARVPSLVGNFPLALGIFGAGVALALPGGESIRGRVHHRPAQPPGERRHRLWVFKVPKPGSSASRKVLVGILVAAQGASS
jgi:glucose uptake protein GlcU